MQNILNKYPNVTLMHQTRLDLGAGHEILGTPLWTRGPEHQADKTWLECAAAQGRPAARLILTHHLPSWRAIHPRFAHFRSKHLFASHCDSILSQTDYWIHGHSHDVWDQVLNGARLIRVARRRRPTLLET